MSTNLRGKTRSVNEPYEVWVAGALTEDGYEWEWRVLKGYQSPEAEATNPYARCFCAVQGPGTWDGYDLGDTYINHYNPHATRLPNEEIADHVAAHPWREY